MGAQRSFLLLVDKEPTKLRPELVVGASTSSQLQSPRQENLSLTADRGQGLHADPPMALVSPSACGLLVPTTFMQRLKITKEQELHIEEESVGCSARDQP